MTQYVNKFVIDQPLIDLQNEMIKFGFDIRLVGGCVRDHIAGLKSKDIDLCTNATPTQQIEIYKKLGIRYIETGLLHGTITVVLNNILYEITSLRVDVDTDGRHATVAFSTERSLDPIMLSKFEALGYHAEIEYDYEELVRVFQQIIQ
jgi:tRNA nucleotidyltransferase/poly(A) polymerase